MLYRYLPTNSYCSKRISNNNIVCYVHIVYSSSDINGLRLIKHNIIRRTSDNLIVSRLLFAFI